MSQVVKTVSLYYKNDAAGTIGSDKVYIVEMTDAGGGLFHVTGYNGRRNENLTPRPQTEGAPVSRARADEIFNKLVEKKKNDRKSPYKEGEPYNIGGSFVPPDAAERDDVQCQLLTPIDDPERAADVVVDDNYAVQEKYDGKRILLFGERSGIVGYNRSNKAVALPGDLVSAGQKLVKRWGDFQLDGEQVGVEYYAFDLLSLAGDNLREYSFFDRWLAFKALGNSHFDVIFHATTEFHKQRKVSLVEQLFKRGAEGAVLKHIHSRYLPGRQRDQFKFKFTTTASCIVTGKNEKNSVSIGVFDNGNLIPVGNVTIRNSRTVVKEGDVVEVRYLYAHRGGSLVQPFMIRVRDDVGPNACLISQLKYKGEPYQESPHANQTH